MRILGVDYGRRRLGLAISDAAGLLARPWQTIPAGGGVAQAAAAVAACLAEDADLTADVSAIVVGLPRRLSGEDTELTAEVRRFAAALNAATERDVHLQDERLSSHEAEARLAELERDWRVRKARLDAAAAAVILQDYLDRGRAPVTAEVEETDP
ncbi:MAG TPA: Holliday junction resolvase RuvX [Vicinamibacterales bacterium]|nr:Holliday junction resolvase RuvX [Vicinamibacterales bacterium]